MIFYLKFLQIPIVSYKKFVFSTKTRFNPLSSIINTNDVKRQICFCQKRNFLLNYPSELKLDSGYNIDAFLFMLLLLSSITSNSEAGSYRDTDITILSWLAVGSICLTVFELFPRIRRLPASKAPKKAEILRKVLREYTYL